MHIPWKQIEQRVDALSEQLAAASLEQAKRALLQKEFSQLNELLNIHRQLDELEQQIATSRSEQTSEDSELAELYEQEITELEQRKQVLQSELEGMLFPPDELDNRNAFIEIRSGAGGQEAALFAADLVKMYTAYALLKGWGAEIMELSSTDLGGVREAVLHIKGKNVYGLLKHEAGVHRVQRVPKTETQGRVHTSTATVAVLPEAKEVDVAISPSDLRIDTYRASGAGGQHVNKTDSAVRITHVPTGVVVACQDERSQHKNRAKALKVLQARIMAHEKEKQEADTVQKRREMVGGGMRAEKVRTYNYPQNRITDHQVDLTLKKLDIVMQGDLDEIIQALQNKEREVRKRTGVLDVIGVLPD